MNFSEAMNYFYFKTSVNELRWFNEENVGELNISYNSLLYLNVIAYTQDCTISKLAEIIRITKPAVTIKVNELVRRGYVEKQQSTEDRRVFYLRLSPAMAAQYGMYDTLGAATELDLLSRHSPEELALFGRMLQEVADFVPGNQGGAVQ